MQQIGICLFVKTCNIDVIIRVFLYVLALHDVPRNFHDMTNCKMSLRHIFLLFYFSQSFIVLPSPFLLLPLYIFYVIYGLCLYLRCYKCRQKLFHRKSLKQNHFIRKGIVYPNLGHGVPLRNKIFCGFFYITFITFQYIHIHFMRNKSSFSIIELFYFSEPKQFNERIETNSLCRQYLQS